MPASASRCWRRRSNREGCTHGGAISRRCGMHIGRRPVSNVPSPAPRRRFWPWVFLCWFSTAVLVLGAFSLLLENHLGERAWEDYRRRAKAAGEPVDPDEVTPPPVPDNENFAKIP